MTVKTDNYQVGVNATATNNFTATTDGAGGMKIARGVLPTTTQDILTIDSTGNVSVPNGSLKQSKAKRSLFSVIMPVNFGLLTPGTWQAIGNLWTEVVDSAGAFTTTGGTGVGGVYKPQVAGWYQINCAVSIGGDAQTSSLAAIWKNGGAHKRIGGTAVNSNNLLSTVFSGATLVYLNGTTDYIELRSFTTQTNANVLGDVAGEQTWFNGYLVEAD